MLSRSLLVFACIFSFSLSTHYAQANDKECIHWMSGEVQKNEVSKFLQRIKSLHGDLLKGYQLPEQYLVGYFARRIEPYLSKPTYKEVKHPDVLYRGLLLTPTELENIFRNGMELSKVSWVTAGGGISFSSNVNEAASYIFQVEKFKENAIGVVFEVKMSESMVIVDDPVLNSTRTIYKKHSDIKKEEITNVYVWGRYGLESLNEVENKSKQGLIVPYANWTGVFDREVSR